MGDLLTVDDGPLGPPRPMGHRYRIGVSGQSARAVCSARTPRRTVVQVGPSDRLQEAALAATLSDGACDPAFE
jgi:hypothetical protein